MREEYSKAQRDRILLCSDLVGGSLSPKERSVVGRTLKREDGDVEEALLALPSDIALKTRGILEQGLQLAVELRRLAQQGVGVAFREDTRFKRIFDMFGYAPDLLFFTGSVALLDDSPIPIFASLDAFVDAGNPGILIADRPFEELLRIPSVIDALSDQALLMASDSFRTAAYAVRVNPSAVSGNVFVSGSRSQTEIPQTIQDSLETIVRKGLNIIVGDSSAGVDNEVLDYLRKPLYPHVSVYTVGNTPRVRVEPEWDVQIVETDDSLKGQKKQMVKDRAMGDAADWGLAVFRPLEMTRFGSLRVSAGTLRNSIQLLLAGKPVKLFYVYEDTMRSHNLKTLSDLEDVIASYASERVCDQERGMILSSKGTSEAEDIAQVKHKKILDKYRSLLKEEQRVLGVGIEESCGIPMQPALPLFG